MTRGYPKQSTLRISAAAAVFAAISLASSPASAAYITVYGGPAYDAATQTGYLAPVLWEAPGRTAGNGVAVGYAQQVHRRHEPRPARLPLGRVGRRRHGAGPPRHQQQRLHGELRL